METFLPYFGIGVVIFVVLSVITVVITMLFARSEKRVKPQYYSLGQEWTFQPLLFSATEISPVGPSAHVSYDDPNNYLGGSAHGKW